MPTPGLNIPNLAPVTPQPMGSPHPDRATQTWRAATLGSRKAHSILSPQKPVEKPSRWGLCTTFREVGQPGWAAFSLSLLLLLENPPVFPSQAEGCPKVPRFVSLPFTKLSSQMFPNVFPRPPPPREPRHNINKNKLEVPTLNKLEVSRAGWAFFFWRARTK